MEIAKLFALHAMAEISYELFEYVVLIKGGLSKNNSYKHVRRGTDKLV